MSNNDDQGYEVGYGKPPKNTQFKTGLSGNPKGRPPGSKNINLRYLLEKELERKIKIKGSGEEQKISLKNAIIRQMVNKAAQGQQRSAEFLFKFLNAWELIDEQNRITEEQQQHCGVLVAPADISPEDWIQQEQKNNDKKREKMAQERLEQVDPVEETSAPEKTRQISVINSF